MYCSKFCFSISEWKDIILAGAAVVAAYKAYIELSKYSTEKRKEQELKSIEFTLEQHRRLFDDKDLYSVLCLIDNDDIKLEAQEMWDAKRKLLVFFEEIQLLTNSNQINKNVSHYLFGYYAIAAGNGANFRNGIDLKEEFFGLFFIFKKESEKFFADCKKDPNLILDLKFSII